MAASLPCLIFSEDGRLCDIKGIRKKYPQYSQTEKLEALFLKSLRGDLRDFTLFCAMPFEPDAPEYRIYMLKQFPEFRCAYCEKNVIRGTTLNFVFLSSDVTEFSDFLSPSSQYFRELPNRLTYELLYIKSDRFYDYSQVSPEAFLLTSRVPHLAEALFPVRSGACYCDLIRLTKKILEEMRSRPPYRDWKLSSEVRFHGVREEQSRSDYYFEKAAAGILEFSTPAYTVLLYTLLHLCFSVGENTGLTLDLYDKAAEVTITTTTYSLTQNPGPDATLNALRCLPSDVSLPPQIAVILCELADVRHFLSYDPATGLLTIVLGLGFEHQFKPDYKYSDPYSEALVFAGETADLLRLLSSGEQS